MIRVAVISSSPTVRAGLRALLKSPSSVEEDAIRVVQEASALEQIDLLRLEIDLLLVSGEALFADELEDLLPPGGAEIGLLLLADDPVQARRLANLGLPAWGALPLDASADELQAGVRAVGAGLVVAPPALAESLFLPVSLEGGGLEGDMLEPLTERESQVLQLLAGGLANKQIAVELGISSHTVKFHVSSIYAKLGVVNRAEAVRVGLQRGLVVL
ncbi:MAG: LuxR C-terminal-related transcriptional regulator [Anaerolineales bacterium]